MKLKENFISMMRLREIREALRSVLNYCGYELSRVPRIHYSHAASAHKALLQNEEVKIIFDVGANLGQMTRYYKRWFPKSKIYCFEPFEECFKLLVAKYQKSDLIEPYQLAVSDKIETKTFFVNRFNQTNSLLESASEWKKHFYGDLLDTLEKIQVKTTTIDEFCKVNNISKINILKMDIQGGELMALEGAKDMIGKHEIDLIYTEVGFQKLYEGGAKFSEIVDFLEKYNYTFYGLYEIAYFPKNGILGYADAIFISPAIEESLRNKIHNKYS